MKSVADFKRRMEACRASGKRVRVAYLQTDYHGKIPPVTDRVVSQVMSREFATRLDDGREPYCPWPRAAHFRVDSPDKVTLSHADTGPAVEFISIEFLP
jgi:hypothetical protein